MGYNIADGNTAWLPQVSGDLPGMVRTRGGCGAVAARRRRRRHPPRRLRLQQPAPQLGRPRAVRRGRARGYVAGRVTLRPVAPLQCKHVCGSTGTQIPRKTASVLADRSLGNGTAVAVLLRCHHANRIKVTWWRQAQPGGPRWPRRLLPAAPPLPPLPRLLPPQPLGLLLLGRCLWRQPESRRRQRRAPAATPQGGWRCGVGCLRCGVGCRRCAVAPEMGCGQQAAHASVCFTVLRMASKRCRFCH